MKKSRFNRFSPGSHSSAVCVLLAVAGFSTAPAFAVNTPGVPNTYNGSLAANGLGSGGNWTEGSPFSASGAGAYADLIFTGADSGSTFTASGGANTFMNAESYNVTDGKSYTLQINSTTAARFNVGATSDTGTSLVVLPFINSVSGIAQDLIYLSNGSDLTFNATNDNGGSPAILPIVQAGNFNVGTDSILTVNSAITGSPAITITGSGSTVFTGANTYSGATTISGGALEIAGSHAGNGALTLSNGLVKISGTRSGTGSTTVRNGILEISGTNAGTAYTVSNTVNNEVGTEPVLKLSNLTALPLGAKITGSDSTARDGIVDLAVAGAYTMSSYEKGNITFTTTSGSPTTLTFTDASKITVPANSVRTFNNASPDLSILFASTLDIGGDVATSVNLTGSGNTTVAAGILSTGTETRGLTKGGSGTLTLNGESAYAGSTTINGGVLHLGHPNALPGGIGAAGGSSNLVFNTTTGVIGLATGDFLREVGTGAGQVTANPTETAGSGRNMGFAAFGGDRVVDFGATLTLSSISLAGVGLTLGASTSDGKVTVVNDIALVNSSRTVLVNDGSAAVDAELSGVISSTGGTLVKTGDGTLALTGANIYGSAGGGTEVRAGVLLIDGDSLSDTSKLVIDGGKVQLTGTETVGTLFFGEVQQIAGTYGPLGSALPIIASENFTGTGTLIVTTDPVAGNSYETWAGINAGGQTANLDFDNDGVSNGIEFFMGETGSTFTPNPGLIAGKITWPRDPAAVATFKVQISETLAPGGWTDIVPPHSSIDETNPNQIIFTLPTDGPKKFARLVVNP